MNNRVELDNHDAADKSKLRCRCSKTELLQKLEYVSCAVMKKAPLPVLEGVLLCIKDGKLSLTGYNMEFAIRTFVDADNTEDGAVVVQLKLFTEMLRSLTDDELILEEDAGNTVVIRCGNAKCKLIGEPAKDFPVLPNVTGTQQFSLPASQLVDMIRQTIFAVVGSHTSASEYVLFDIKPDELSLIACDGVRMAVQRESIPCGMNDSITVPTETLKKFQKLFAKMDKELAFQYDRQQSAKAQIVTDDFQIFFRLASGKILYYKRYIPSENTSSAVVAVKDLLRILKRCSLLKSNTKLHRVQMLIQKEKIDVVCRGSEGSVEDVVPCKYNGEDIAVEFDVKQLLSIVKESRTEQLSMTVYDEIHPVYFSPVNNDKRWFLLATMRPEKRAS